MEKAIFAAGCFWGVEATFRKIPGVISTRVGYIGGKTFNPTYEDVCSDETGHAEAIEVTFDSKKVSYDALLDVFFTHHDPTTLNRQGVDVGTQYRSAIFYVNEEQRNIASINKQKWANSGKFKKPIVTEINKATTFFPAEEYHQQYLEKQGAASCSMHPAED